MRQCDRISIAILLPKLRHDGFRRAEHVAEAHYPKHRLALCRRERLQHHLRVTLTRAHYIDRTHRFVRADQHETGNAEFDRDFCRRQRAENIVPDADRRIVPHRIRVPATEPLPPLPQRDSRRLAESRSRYSAIVRKFGSILVTGPAVPLRRARYRSQRSRRQEFPY